MVPPEGIDKIQPTTLPADFGEWDSGENQETKPEEVTGFDRYPAAPPAPLKPAPAPKAPAARVAVLPPVERERPPAVAPPPRKPARRYPEPEPVYERPQVQDLDEDDYDEENESKAKQKKMMIAAAAVVVLAAGGVFGYFKLASKPAAPTQQVAQQSTTTVVPTEPAGTATVVVPSKPGAATAATTAAPQTATPAEPAATQEPAPATGRQAEAMNRQLNATPRITNDLKALGGQAPTGGFSPSGMDMGGAGTNVFAPGSGPKVTVGSQKKVSISAGIAVGLLVQKTAPVYPAIARQARISGTVVIQATISKSGTVENPRVVSGPTMLRQAALDAVKSWRYRPYLLDGTPVEVDTTVNVVFNLGG